MSTKFKFRNPFRKKEQPAPLQPIQLRPVIGIPMERAISHADKVFFNFIGIAQHGIPFIKSDYGRTDLGRNRFAIHLLKSDFTHLIMLDLDHIHPVDIVHRLMRHFHQNPALKIVGGLNFRRGAPFDPCAFIRGDNGSYYAMSQWEKGLIKVDALGTGCIAIAREVFEQLEPPWFYNDYSKVLEDIWPGEDIGFAEKCRLAGIDQYVDTTLTSPHIIDSIVDEQVFVDYTTARGIESMPVESVRAEAKAEPDEAEKEAGE